MPNDAKLALVIGVGLVVVVAIVFYHKDLIGTRSADDKAPASVGNPPPTGSPSSGTPARRPLSARPTGLVADPGMRELTSEDIPTTVISRPPE